jgi:hypothetical protein
VLRISKRPEPVNIVHCPSCNWHEPFCYSRRHRPTPKNTLRGNPGCAVGLKTPTGTPKGSTFDLIGYSDADWAGCKIDRKSTSGTCQYLGRSLVSWASKKQNSIALSTAEAEYIVAGHCCAQLLWMRQTLRDYGYKWSKVPLLCDNESAIRMADNPVEHSRTKHIAIQYHFLRDHQQRGDIEIAYVSTKEQLADIFGTPRDPPKNKGMS